MQIWARAVLGRGYISSWETCSLDGPIDTQRSATNTVEGRARISSITSKCSTIENADTAILAASAPRSSSKPHFEARRCLPSPGHSVFSCLRLGACAIGCFCWPPLGFAGNETSDCLLGSATRGHRPAGGGGMPVDGPAGRADWGRIALLHAAASPCIRFMFSARHTRAHSPCAWFKPRTLKWRKPSACLIHPLGASDSHLRLAYCA